MKLHRFILDFTIRNNQIEISDAGFVKQVTHVLRLKAGDEILLCDGKLNEVLAEITDTKNHTITFMVKKTSVNESESKNHVTLYCSVLKRENFEWVAQKATEVGVAEIVPLITKRTVKTNLRQDRLEKIIKEAAEQSGRGLVPVLHKPMDFKKAIENAKGSINLFFDISGSGLDVSGQKSEVANIWIGPEGGWDQTEIIQAKKAGFQMVSLGKLTLRAETAAVVASFLSSNL